MDVANDGRVSLGLSSVVRVTLKDGTQHEDVGYGTIENAKSKAMAFEKVLKTQHFSVNIHVKLLNNDEKKKIAENQLDRLLSQDDFEWENTLDEIIGVIEYDQPTPRSTANPSGPFGNPQTTIFNNSASLSESTPSQPVFIKSEANSHAKASFKDSFIGRPATGGEPHQMAEGNTGSNYETGGKNSGGGFGNSNSSGFVLASKIHK
ncbi:DNA repair and recombination protein RAD52 [Zancudomyces culisetae]|uniref:DNA repair and recombination protein RAD52 n=1 Tax=Zancudomyces culisetae TaxID=1213189 RepID=A0A1R1PY99_ZANCU|nr:DNA repair and recombination protein RAD52 [Zancudomyces culisetae]|eukprot:OMH85933.1 DNA repair and recombination protein RAD52 [Zancudomyces culisetae]